MRKRKRNKTKKREGDLAAIKRERSVPFRSVLWTELISCINLK